jgi:hypothetical protein
VRLKLLQVQNKKPGFLENPEGNRAVTRFAHSSHDSLRSDVVARGRIHVPTLSNPTRPSRIPRSTTFPLTPSQDAHAPVPTRQRAACLVRCSERTMSQLLPSLGAVIAVHVPSDLITVVGQIRAAVWLLWTAAMMRYCVKAWPACQ